ncbi:hypothetical protein L810_1925 [Burkholderia sp. AU4i]|nr:hypothetical protein L810_1925 [Burkholderia sp. AU4i]MDW9248828.1 hypothetical protein [Burkholderia cepacia]
MLCTLLRHGMHRVRLDVMRGVVGALPGRVVKGWPRRAACVCMPCRNSLFDCAQWNG